MHRGGVLCTGGECYAQGGWSGMHRGGGGRGMHPHTVCPSLSLLFCFSAATEDDVM